MAEWTPNRRHGAILERRRRRRFQVSQSFFFTLYTICTMNTKEKEKYIEEFDFPYCDESSKYEKVAKIGQGTFG